MSNEFIRQLAQKSSVNAVVQKSVNLYNIAGKNLSLARNALLVMVAAGMCYGAGTVLARTRSIILERERRESWTQKAALEGKL